MAEGAKRSIPRGAARRLHDLHGELLAAVEAEIQALRKVRRSTGTPVVGGTLTTTNGGRYYYSFPRPARIGGLRPGREVTLEAETETVTGFVSQVATTEITICFDADLGGVTPPGWLQTDILWLWSALRARILNVDAELQGRCNQRARPFRFHDAARVFGIGDLSLPAPADHQQLKAAPETTLTSEQRTVVSLGGYARTLYVWGPPGTGKTYTLVELARALLSRQLRVLLVAQTNDAADNLLEGIAAAEPELVASEGLLRFGPPESVTLPAELRRQVCVEQLVGRRLGPLALADLKVRRADTRRVIASCRAIATTVHQCFLAPALLGSDWDVLIVDEAARIAPAMMYVAAGLAARHVIAGDFRQTRPIATGSTVEVEAWLRRDPFEVIGIPDDIEREDYPEYLVMLREQFRMAPSICGLVADAYDHKLRTAKGVLERRPGPLGSDALLLIDSSLEDATVDMDRYGSRRNAVHRDLLHLFLEAGLAAEALREDELRDMLVITPFVAQAALLDQSLKAAFGRRRPRVRTVHQCQGREADLVVLDLVDAPGPTVSGFLRADSYRSDGGRLQTVAVTRARQHLLVIAHHEHLSARGGRLVRTLLQRIRSSGRRLPVDGLRARTRAA